MKFNSIKNTIDFTSVLSSVIVVCLSVTLNFAGFDKSQYITCACLEEYFHHFRFIEEDKSTTFFYSPPISFWTFQEQLGYLTGPTARTSFKDAFSWTVTFYTAHKLQKLLKYSDIVIACCSLTIWNYFR